MAFITLPQGRIEYRMTPGDALGPPPVVLLHEGLGCVALWRDFPDKLAQRLKTRVLAYSRFGYGQSDGIKGPRTPRFMHEEALEVLPALLDALGIARPLLVGHSDGASIALIHAASAGRDVAGLVLMAPHVVVEPVTVKSIAAIAESYERGDLRSRLAAYHARVDDAFLGWSRIWLSPQFQTWSLGTEVAALRVPSLAIQGEDDEYGSLAQLDALSLAPRPSERLVIAQCRHSPYREKEAEVLAAIETFARRLQIRCGTTAV